MSQKVFFIGASKMVTSSISDALKEQGKRVVHHPRYGIYSHLNQPDHPYFDQYDYFLDGNFHNFVHLDQWFPHAKFVILDRQPATWLPSLFNWLQYIDSRHMKGEWLVIFFYKLIFGRWIYERIMTDYNIFRMRANHYFQGRDNYINLDIEAEGDEGWKKLSDFLGIDLAPKWSNRQTEKVMPDWLKLAIEKSEKKAAGANMTYPIFKPTGRRSKLLNRIHLILIRDFVHERHLFRNMGMAFEGRSLFSPKAYALAISHIGKFMRLIFCLMVRIRLVKDRQFCPYIF